MLFSAYQVNMSSLDSVRFWETSKVGCVHSWSCVDLCKTVCNICSCPISSSLCDQPTVQVTVLELVLMSKLLNAKEPHQSHVCTCQQGSSDQSLLLLKTGCLQSIEKFPFMYPFVLQSTHSRYTYIVSLCGPCMYVVNLSTKTSTVSCKCSIFILFTNNLLAYNVTIDEISCKV